MDKEKYFSNYEAFTENEISEISEYGITLKNGMYIDFDVCASVWAKVNLLKESSCVGERESNDLSFTFYTLPKPIMIKFIEKGMLPVIISKHKTYQRFYDLQNKIIKYGYRTFDVT